MEPRVCDYCHERPVYDVVEWESEVKDGTPSRDTVYLCEECTKSEERALGSDVTNDQTSSSSTTSLPFRRVKFTLGLTELALGLTDQNGSSSVSGCAFFFAGAAPSIFSSRALISVAYRFSPESVSQLRVEREPSM